MKMLMGILMAGLVSGQAQAKAMTCFKGMTTLQVAQLELNSYTHNAYLNYGGKTFAGAFQVLGGHCPSRLCGSQTVTANVLTTAKYGEIGMVKMYLHSSAGYPLVGSMEFYDVGGRAPMTETVYCK